MIPDDTRLAADAEAVKQFRFAPFAPAAVAALALIFLVFHLAYLPSHLEDLDSINFALGLRQFDVASHQPHPPGYPLFIAAAKAMRAVTGSEVKALALLSVIAGALGVIAIAMLFQQLTRDRSGYGTVAATALAAASPLYWFTAARPLSDTAGLAAAVAVQAAILAAPTDRASMVASFCAGFAAGIRSQVVWLTLPLLIAKVIFFRAAETRHHGRRRGGHGARDVEAATAVQTSASASPVSSVVFVSKCAGAYILGVLVWAVPLVMLSGGPIAYWRAVFSQGAEDLTGVQMLWTTPTPRVLVSALYYALVAPWAVWPIAAAVLALGAAGVLVMSWHDRPPLALVAIAFGPYLVFDIVFQETFTGRYALPLVVPMAFLAGEGARRLLPQIGPAFVVVIAMMCAHIGGTSVAAYARTTPPAFRLLDDMRAAAPASSQPPVLAMDRREALDFRRPLRWRRDSMPPVAQTLPSPPQHEWLELVKYWNGGGRAPVWFVADPLRTDIDLVQHPSPFTYRWSLPYPVLLSGVRPNEMDWFVLERPEWFVGAGWELTPEAAGVAAIERRGLQYGSIEGAIARGGGARGVMIIGGRNLEPSTEPRLTVSIAGTTSATFTVPPGPFAQVVTFPSVRSADGGERGYLPLSVRSEPPARVAIEQFDASRSRTIVGYGNGWQEPEYNPASGLRWRWMSERAQLILAADPFWGVTFTADVGRGSPPPKLVLHIEGESPRKYFARGSIVTIRSNVRDVSPLITTTLDNDFALDVPLPPGTGALTIETDQFFSPADRSRPWRRSGDRRHLGLRIFKCEIRPAS